MPAPREPEPIIRAPPPEGSEGPRPPVQPISLGGAVHLAICALSFLYTVKFGLWITSLFVIWFGIHCAWNGRILIGTRHRPLWLFEGPSVVAFGVLTVALGVFMVRFFDVGWRDAL